MDEVKLFNRRDFLKQIGMGGLLLTSGCRLAPLWRPGRGDQPLRFGVVADVHFGLHPAAHDRLVPFNEEMNRRGVDFIIQLGDFTQGYRDADRRKFDDFMRLWNSFRGPTYHVLGNHDMDRCSKRAAMDYWEMPANFYSFDRGGRHFVVLDSNYYKFDDAYVGYDTGNYFKHSEARSYLSPSQLDWLRRDLAATDRPTILFSHRGLDPQRGVKDGKAARAILDQANLEAGFQKVAACFCGHYHRDGCTTINGIHYITVNSAVYHWLGGKWKWVPYADSLYATATLRPNLLEVEGKTSRLVPPWPPDAPDAPELGPDISARISDLRLRFSLATTRSWQ